MIFFPFHDRMLILTKSHCVFIYSQVTSVMWDPLVGALWIASRWPMPGRWACSGGRSNPGKSCMSPLGSKREQSLHVKGKPWKQVGFSFRGLVNILPFRSLEKSIKLANRMTQIWFREIEICPLHWPRRLILHLAVIAQVQQSLE